METDFFMEVNIVREHENLFYLWLSTPSQFHNLFDQRADNKQYIAV